MRTIYLDDGTRLDDPNAYWGDPSYLLEPGDPGYVPPLPIQPTPRKRKRMATHNSYFPSNNPGQVIWLGNFRNKLPLYAAALTLAAGQLAAAQADCDWLMYVIGTWLPAVRTFAKAGTDAVADAEFGTLPGAMALPTFTGPAGGTPVEAGALTRVFTLVRDIRNKPTCTDAIISDLGLEGSEEGAPDWNVFGPVLKLTRAPAAVTVGWTWRSKAAFLDQCEIEVDRGDGQGWRLLAIDTTPGYVDTFPIPITPTKWQYRAIYRVGDQRIGQWSAEASVIVGG